MKGSISSNIVILIFFCFASVLRSDRDALGSTLPHVLFPGNSSPSAMMMMMMMMFTSSLSSSDLYLSVELELSRVMFMVKLRKRVSRIYPFNPTEDAAQHREGSDSLINPSHAGS